MIIKSLANFIVIDKKKNREIEFSRDYILDYADDLAGIYSLKGDGKYKVVNREIEIIRK